MSGEVSLLRLHALVPAAEEIDLAEEAEVERAWRWWQRESTTDQAGSESGEALAAALVEAAGEDEPGPELSLGQALGLLEAELGARPVAGRPDRPQ